MEREIRRALRSLGNTPRQIANTLFNKGIVGDRDKLHQCPIATYLRQEFPFLDIRVTPFHVFYADIISDAISGMVEVSQPIHRFVCYFDDGRYPELIK